MDVVGADVVLDQQAWAVARDGGVKPGVRKLQIGGAVQAAHEGADQRAVIVLHLPGVGAVHVFGGHFTRQCIDLLVQVHDQQVQAVAALAVAVGQFGQCGAAQTLVVGQGMELAQPVVSPHGQRVCAGLPGVAQGAGHGGEVVRQRLQQVFHVGQDQQVVVVVSAAQHFRGPGGVLQTGVRDVRLPASYRPIGRGRMLRRRLQKGEVQLEPVVGRQGSFDPRGHQQRGLPQGRNRFFLEHQEFLR